MFIKLLMFVLGLGARHAAHDRPAALDDSTLPSYARATGFIFALAFVAFLYWFLGAGGGGPSAVGFRYALVMLVIVGGTTIVVLVALIRSAVFRSKGLVHRAISLVLALAIIGMWTVDPRGHHLRRSSRSVSTPSVVATPEMSAAARTRAAEAERQQLIAKLEALRASNHQSWLAHIESSGATGPPGMVPPMLEVRVTRPGVWKIRNLAVESICVRLGRVARSRQPGAGWIHCELDAANTCLEIPPGGSRVFALESDGLTGGCPNTSLEFRVGHEQHPGPSWWTDSALVEIRHLDPNVNASHRRWTAAQLRGEIAAIEKLRR